MNDHVRSAIYAFASMIGVVVAMFLLAIFMASLNADVGFSLTWRTSMLFFPFHYARAVILPGIVGTIES